MTDNTGDGKTYAQLHSDNNLGTLQTDDLLIASRSGEMLGGALFPNVPTVGGPLGQPLSGDLLNCTNLPVHSLRSSLSSDLLSVISDAIGSGFLVFNNGPTFVNPTLGNASATTLNKLIFTAPATSATFTLADGKTFACSNTLTFTGTDSSSINFGGGGTVLYNSGPLGTPSSGTLINCTGLPLSGTTGTLAVNRGGTGVTSLPTTATASAFAAWDSNSNISANNVLEGRQSVTTAAGTTTLTVASVKNTVFTGSTTQTCVLPVVSTLVLGTAYRLTNLSSGVVTVQSSGANTIQAMQANSTLLVSSNATSGTSASVWDVLDYTCAASGQTGTGNLVRATGPTITLPNATGLPISTGLTGTGTGVLAALSSAVTGSGGIVCASSPSLTTPTIGAASATSINFGQSNSLSYYDQGTFTPAFSFDTPGNLSVSYTTQIGSYTRVGNLVHITINIDCTPTFSTASGNIRITNLPFTSKNSASTQNTSIPYLAKISFTNLPTVYLDVNLSYCQLLQSASGTTGSFLGTGQVASGTAHVQANFSLTYLV